MGQRWFRNACTTNCRWPDMRKRRHADVSIDEAARPGELPMLITTGAGMARAIAWMPGAALMWSADVQLMERRQVGVETEGHHLEEEAAWKPAAEAENTATESSLGAASKTPVVEEQRGQDFARSPASVPPPPDSEDKRAKAVDEMAALDAAAEDLRIHFSRERE